MKMNRLLGLGIFAGAAMLPGTLLADSISPSSYGTTIAQGGSVTVHKTVTVEAGAPTTAQLDVYFMADTTGSMGSTISSVKSGASTMLASLASYGNVNFAVGEYRDFGDYYTYRLNTAMTSSSAAAQSGINMWSAGGGGDWEEAELYALTRAANDAATGWRAGSARVLVWFGDAPGHDPSGGATLGSTKTALQNAHIKVEAIDVGSMNYYGQASAIANATGGTYFSGVSPSQVVAKILEGVGSSFATYSSVGLDLSEVPAGVSATYGGPVTGSFDRSVTRTFEFDLTFTGDTAGIYNFNTYATVDGGRMATEADRITVEKKDGVPDAGSSVALLGLALLGLRGLRRFVA